MSEIVLTKGQEEAIRVAVERYKRHEKFTVIAGYAGCGKTFTVQYIIKELGLKDYQVNYACYTRKAALVLQSKGCAGAMTCHELLMHSRELPDGTWEHRPRASLENRYCKLVVIDEVSMMPQSMWDLLMSFNVHVIALGDSFQLDAIEQSVDVLQRPNAFLDEIVRQAEDSEIINLSMKIRNGEPLTLFKGNDVRVIRKEQVGDGLLLGSDVILCAKNVTRFALNQQVRKIRWGDQYTAEPLNNDKIVCLKNSRQFPTLANGLVGTISDIRTEETKLWHPRLTATFNADTGDCFPNLHMDMKLFTAGITTINKDNWMHYTKKDIPNEITWGYCLTVHKMEGSEADKVLVYNERMQRDETEYRRWLYTAITRAKMKLVIAI